MSEEILRLDRARLAYGEREVWSGLDVTVANGEFLAVLGPNGCGKTRNNGRSTPRRPCGPGTSCSSGSTGTGGASA